MIEVVALHDRLEPLARLRHRCVPAPLELLLDLLQLRPQAPGHRPALYGKVPLPVLPADMREAQKVERFRLPFSSSFPVRFGVPPELDPARLVRMQFQSKLPQSFPEILPKTVGFGLDLEPKDRIVGVTHDDDGSSCVFLAPRLHPKVKDVMQIDIGQQRRDHRPLRRIPLRLRPYAFLHHPGLQPFLDQAEDPAVGNAMLYELEHPFVGNRIEKSPDVSVKNVVHPLLRERLRECVQRLMLATSRSKAVREAQKVLLIDCLQDSDHGLLDDLILQGRDPQRALPPVAFRDVHPSRGQGSVRPAVDPAVQISQPTLQPRLILLPPQAVHPRGGFPLQSVKAAAEQIDGKMVEQSGELHLLVFLRGFPHPRQPLGHVCPALCWVRVRRRGVLLDQRPSLCILRRGCSLLVRMTHRYYAAVRLLGDVHTGRPALAFARRPANLRRRLRGLPVPVQEVSRRIWGLRLRRTGPGLALSPRVMLPSAESDRVGVLIARFRSSIPSPPIPLFTLRCTPRGAQRKTRGRVDRYSFLVRIFHPLLSAGLSRRLPDFRLSESLRLVQRKNRRVRKVRTLSYPL